MQTTPSHKETRLTHALITVITMSVLMFVSIVLLDLGPHIPLVFGTLAAGLVAAWLGYSWEEILDGMIAGITNSLEAILILLMIGMLVASWIAAGSVSTMICYGLKLVSPKIFLPATMGICFLIAFAIGSWGTVGTIGLAFMGMGIALNVPAPLVAGAIVSGAYMGEVVSPLSDATNLAAAVTGGNVFSIVKKVLPAACTAGALAILLYTAAGLSGGSFTSSSAGASSVSDQIAPLLEQLERQFRITPLALLPMLLVIICILKKLPAIPSMLFGAMAGMLQAVLLQGKTPGEILSCAYSGYVSNTGSELIDTLLTAGGMERMMESVSIILIAMAFGGIMKKSRQMDALVYPIVSRLHTAGQMTALTVVTCFFMNVILPDQYLSISMPGQMYESAAARLGISKEKMAATLLGGGAVTSPLVPWNTCGIYCMTILGISPVRYAPYAFYGMLLPVITILLSIRKSRSSACF